MTKVLYTLVPVLTVLVGLLSKVLMQLLRRGVSRVDQLPKAQKTAVFAVLTTAISIAARFIPGVDLPTDVNAWDVGTIQTLLSIALGVVVHKLEHDKGPAVAASTPADPPAT